jgi:hypothetical protein
MELTKFNMTKERQKQLEDYELMLGRITNLVQEFCEEDETTLQGVAKLVATYRDYQAQEAWDFVDSLHLKKKI